MNFFDVKLCRLGLIGLLLASFASAQSGEKDSHLHADGPQGWGVREAKVQDPNLPRVLLVGDSILNGYLATVIHKLDGKANVDAWVNPYHQASEGLHEKLRDVLAGRNYAVIQFHWNPEGSLMQGRAVAASIAGQLKDLVAAADARPLSQVIPLQPGSEVSHEIAAPEGRFRNIDIPTFTAFLPDKNASAGANLAIHGSAEFHAGQPSASDPVERLSSRPDFIALLCPWAGTGGTQCPYKLRADSPPTFICHSKDDKVAPVSVAQDTADTLQCLKVPVELHPFDTGGHGNFTPVGQPPGGQWPILFLDWLRKIMPNKSLP